MSFAHLAKLRSQTGAVTRDPVPAMAEAMSGILMLHRELMAEKDETLRLTRALNDDRQALAELRDYVRLLERELERAINRPPDVDGWRESA